MNQLLDVDGAAVEYYQCGERGVKNLVLLHEGLGCIALWRDFPNKLKAISDTSVTVYSRTGYGNSDPINLPRPLDHMRREACAFLPRFLEVLNIERPILVGHSDGATIALEFAAAFPSKLAGLVLMAPHVFVEQQSLNAIEAANLAYATGDLREKLRRYHGENVDNAFRGWCDTWLNPTFRNWDMRDVLRDIRVPILQIQGRNDEYGTLAHTGYIERESNGPVKTVVYGGCGHSPHLEKPEEALQEIANFVENLQVH